MMTNPIVQWGTHQLKATVLAALASRSALKITLRRQTGKDVISEEQMQQMMLQVQNTLDLAENTVKGKNLDIILTVSNRNTSKEEVIRGKYDNIATDRAKLESTGRQLLHWFPVNFKSFQDWQQYSDELQESFLAKRQVLTA